MSSRSLMFSRLKLSFCNLGHLHLSPSFSTLIPQSRVPNLTSDLNLNEHELNSNKSTVLDPCLEDISHLAPYPLPAFNLAAYVNKSETLKQLVRLGVNLHKLENRKGVPQLLLSSDFDKDIKPYLQFLDDHKIPSNELGNVITKAPFILKQSLDDLQVRINYLESKNFSQDQIVRIILKSPQWITYRTVNIDKRLGFFQYHFTLSGDEVRHVATRRPQIVTSDLKRVEGNMFSIREEMGFSVEESKQILMDKPKVYQINRKLLVSRFEYIHNTMSIPHNLILQQVQSLLSREERLKQRHQFLVCLKKAQYNPNLPGYISLASIVAGNDSDFCSKVAKSSVTVYNTFLKTL